MGNSYVAPKRTGASPFTRSGEPPVKLNLSRDKPQHRVNERMSLELHMGDERARTSGLTPAEREWRRKWVLDQHLHPDEPVHVDAVHRQLNPIRILYRKPWDALYTRFLQPTFDWEHHRAIYTAPIKHELYRREEYPELLAKGITDLSKYRYFDPSYEKRLTHRDVGEPSRKY